MTTAAIHSIDSPIRGDFSISFGETGFIGKDQRYKFRQTLQLRNGTPLRTSERDRYVNVSITYSGDAQQTHEQLPSSLFEQARFGDQLCFRKANGKLYELRLISRTTDSFDKSLQLVESMMKRATTEFIYYEDICFPCWPGSEHVFLSPETEQVIIGQTGVHPVDCQKLLPLGPRIRPNQDFLNGSRVVNNCLHLNLPACGKPQIEILLDRHHFYVHTVRNVELTDPDGRKLSGPDRVEALFHTIVINCTIDRSHIQASVNYDVGILSLDIPFTPIE